MKPTTQLPQPLRRRRALAETCASAGMLLIGVSMLLPLFNMLDVKMLYTFRWLFGAGTLLFWGARCIPVNAPSDSARIRRMRRMEFWSGACFGVAAVFWFYNCHKYASMPFTGALMILRDTILFSLAGAVIQLIAVWLIYFRLRKEAREDAASTESSVKGNRRKG